MKTTKYLFPVLALGSLLLTTSCQMEDPEPDRITGEVDFTITAGIPGGISTYAPAGTGSHNGGAVLLDPDAYDLRYIMQAYDETDKLAYSATKYVSDNFTTQSVVFEARLIAKNTISYSGLILFPRAASRTTTTKPWTQTETSTCAKSLMQKLLSSPTMPWMRIPKL